MSILVFLGEWALRSSILIIIGGLLLRALRVKDPSVRLAAWVAMLCGSFTMPLLIVKAPAIPVTIARNAVLPSQSLPAVASTAASDVEPAFAQRPIDWARTGVILYAVVCFGLLLRLATGLAMSLRLLKASRPASPVIDGIEIRESDNLKGPVTLGFLRPVIVLPADWPQWTAAKLDAVLAHEHSHIRRCDPAVQLLSALHRVVLWHSPMSWFLHSRIVRVAEEASDDAAVSTMGDRTQYAELLLGFMRLGVRGTNATGVPMARYGRMESRINRILDGVCVSRGVTQRSVALIVGTALPLVWIAAAAHPGQQSQTPPAPVVKIPAAMQPKSTTGESLNGLGSVAASQTVVIRPRVDGLLKSISFREGELVHQGQLIASLDAGTLSIQLAQAQARLEQDRKLLVQQAPIGDKVRQDEAELADLKARLDDAEIKSPITGIAGFKMVDAGNSVHKGEPLVVVTQMQPAVVVFTIPEDAVGQVHRSLANGGSPVVEAWNRDNSSRIASGRLTAIDNLIDEKTGTAKLKAAFANTDGSLFSGQFVNAHLLLSGR